MLERVSDFELLLFLARRTDDFAAPVSAADVLELCRCVRHKDREGAASFRFKLLVALGGGYLDPVLEKDGIEDIRPDLEAFLRHVRNVHRTNRSRVVNPLRSAKALSRQDRERECTGLWDDINRMQDDDDVRAALVVLRNAELGAHDIGPLYRDFSNA
jgi:hypothetical protein